MSRDIEIVSNEIRDFRILAPDQRRGLLVSYPDRHSATIFYVRPRRRSGKD